MNEKSTGDSVSVFGDSCRMALSIEDGSHWINLGH